MYEAETSQSRFTTGDDLLIIADSSLIIYIFHFEERWKYFSNLLCRNFNHRIARKSFRFEVKIL